jgi:hypothetical protein
MIPDVNFRAALKTQFPAAFDSKDSLKYSDPSISGFSGTINASGLNIITLTGIEYFPAVTQLNCSYNLLTSMDLSKNTALKSLICNNNKLASLDISKSTSMTSLIGSSNLLTIIDVSNNVSLVNLFCDNNLLTSLDLSKNTFLGFLDCTANKLTSLDLSKNTALYSLSCTNNQLTTLNISTQTSFSSNLNIIQDVFQVYIGNTGLTTLKVNDAVKQNPEILNIKRTMPTCVISTWNNAVQTCPNYNPITNTCP